MSSVVGHGLAGALCATGLDSHVRTRRLVPFAVVLAVLPDLDTVVYMFFGPVGMIPHRGFSHSLLFALATSSLAFLAGSAWFGRSRGRVFAILLAAAVSHPILDYLMGAGPGVPFFAPWIDAGYLFPIRAVPTAYFTTQPRGIPVLITSPLTWIGVSLEILFFLPLILLRRSRSRTTSIALILTSGGAEVLTLLLYSRA